MDTQTCITNCLECHRICLETIQHCLGKGGKHAEAAHIRLMMDCAQICAVSADFMIRGSQYHKITCDACAQLCEACAKSCEAMADDAAMKRCAEICRRCTESCRQMAA